LEPPRHAFKRTIKSSKFGAGLENTTLPPIRDSQGKISDVTCEGCPAEDTEEKRAYRIQKLAMCLNNMQAAIDHLDDMRGVMKEACMATAKTFPGDPMLEQGVQKISQEAYNDLHEDLKDELEDACQNVANRIVFYDLGENFDRLYLQRSTDNMTVTESRFTAVLSDELNRVIGDYYAHLDDSVMDPFLYALLKGVVLQMKRILYYGGPDRWFDVADFSLIDADMLQLKKYFVKSDDNESGLDEKDVDQIVDELGRSIMKYMGADSEKLIERFEECTEPEMKDVIAHILLHRPGLAAQKYYKDTLKDKYFNNEGSLAEPYKTWPRTQ